MALEPTSTQAPPWPEPLVLILALSAWEAAASWKRPLAASPTLRLRSTWLGLRSQRARPELKPVGGGARLSEQAILETESDTREPSPTLSQIQFRKLELTGNLISPSR